MNYNEKKISKFLSYVLRHHPQEIGIDLDENGWANVEQLLKNSKTKFPRLDFEDIQTVVQNNDKQRFTFNDDCTQIRANQGHSVSIDLDLTPTEPPYTLLHGTVPKFMSSIRKKGLTKQSRQHVHLSDNLETAKNVALRRGVPTILKIDAYNMHKDGHEFYLSENGVWLTDHVPMKYINFD